MLRNYILIILLASIGRLHSADCVSNNCTKPHTKSVEDGEIFGWVWFDTNANGYFDAGEYGIADVQVILYTCSGQLLQTTLTDSDGFYYFGDIPDGSIKIYIEKNTLPAHYSFTFYDYPYTDNHIQSNGFSPCFDIDGSESQINAGMTVLSIVGDYVWEDLDGDGIQDFSESGIGGVTVRLWDENDNLIGETTTASDGSYYFLNIFPGNYYLQFLPDSIWLPTLLNTGNPLFDNDAAAVPQAGLLTGLFNVVAGIDRLDLDAGLYKCAKVCGTIFADNNTNDNLDLFENGINGLNVYLWEIIPDGIQLYDFTMTQRDTTYPSADGHFSFCVPPGRYFVSFILPPNVDLVLSQAFNGDSYSTSIHFDESNGPLSTYDFELQSGDEICYLNAGLYCGSRIIGTVWQDNNYNGLKDSGEAPLAGISVSLFDINSNLVRAAQSQSDGTFELDSLKKGNYYVGFSLPEHLIFTLPLSGGGFTSDIDSDVNHQLGTGTTSVFYLGGCDTIYSISAGYSFAALPVRWIDFSGHKSENHTILNWRIQTDMNTLRFEVMKSRGNNMRFENIGTVSPAEQTNVNSWSFTDLTFAGDNQHIYYMIRHISQDGTIHYSPVIRINPDITPESISIYPNPARDMISVKWENRAIAELTLINAWGVIIKKCSFPQSTGEAVSISTHDIAPGLYTAITSDESGIAQYHKILILH